MSAPRIPKKKITFEEKKNHNKADRSSIQQLPPEDNMYPTSVTALSKTLLHLFTMHSSELHVATTI